MWMYYGVWYYFSSCASLVLLVSLLEGNFPEHFCSARHDRLIGIIENIRLNIPAL